MAHVKSFRIHPDHGVPDKDIREFINKAEKEGIINVTTTYIPETYVDVEKQGINGTIRERVLKADPRVTVICTKLDDHHVD